MSIIVSWYKEVSSYPTLLLITEGTLPSEIGYWFTVGELSRFLVYVASLSLH